MADLKRAIEVKQRELEQLHQKLALPVDTDILRMKIAKDVESRHRLELETRQGELDRVADQFYEAKRQNEIFKAQIESLKSESEKEMRDLKDKHRQELNELTLENQALLARAEDRRDRDLIRQLRRDVDEHKRRCTDLLGECSDLRKERDLLKLERGELLVKHQRDQEELKNEKRLLQSENERLSFKLQSTEEEKQKLLLKVEKRQSEVSGALTDKANQQTLLREKDSLIESLQKQVSQLKGELASAELGR